MEVKELKIEPLKYISEESFKPYGQIFGLRKGPPSEALPFVECWSYNVDLGTDNEKIDLCYCELQRVSGAAASKIEKDQGFPNWLQGYKGGTTVSKMERHPLTTESFFFLDEDVIFVMAPPDNSKKAPNLTMIRAFLLDSSLGISLWKGTWHWPPIPLYKSARIAILRKGDLSDFDRVDLGVEYKLVI
jgi:ureidoglycolate hydrolase